MPASLPALRRSLPASFRACLQGAGWGWLGALSAVWIGAALLSGSWGMLLRFASLGVLSEYAAGLYQNGIDGRNEAPPWRRPDDFSSGYVWPTLSLSALALLLWSPTIVVSMITALDAMARASLAGPRAQAWDHVRFEWHLWSLAGIGAAVASYYWPLAVLRLRTTGHASGAWDAFEIFHQGWVEYGARYAVLAALGLPVVGVFGLLLSQGGTAWTAAWIVGPFGLTVLTGVQSHQIGRWEALLAEDR